jgi:beta-glucosidase
VQPEENRWDEEAIRHYQGVIKALKDRGLEPVVTLHHFTIPAWFSRLGGWENPKSAQYFAAYTRTMVRALGPDIRFWITFNELNVLTYKGYLEGAWPPGKKKVLPAWRAIRHLVQAAYQSYAAIHAEYQKQAWPVCRVGVAHHLMCADPADPQKSADRKAAKWRQFFNNDLFLRLLMGRTDDWVVILAGCSGKGRAMDFIGVNYYFREIIRAKSNGPLWEKMIGEVDREVPAYKNIEKNDLGWAVYPEGIRRVALEASKTYRLPLMITENGICTHDESQRARFIQDHLTELKRAMDEGADVIGYLYWSLLDNFEWSIGYMPRFGLVAVDPETLTRAVKPSAQAYSRICRSNRVI